MLPDVPSMIVPPGLSLPGLLGVLDHLHRHAVLDRVAGVGRLDLGVDVGGDDALGDAVEAHHRRVADGFEDVVVDCFGIATDTSVVANTIIHASFCCRWRCSCCWRSCTRGRWRPRPAHWSRVDPGDGALNIWDVGGSARAAAPSRSRLFEANIFYPEHLTLAYSEAMIVQGVLAAPVVALGGSAVLAYNVVARLPAWR